MAMFIPGMRCVISGRPIHTAEEAVCFPPFIANEADPLYVFSDAVIHADVFAAHPLAPRVQARLDEARRQTAVENRKCMICGQPVSDPDDYVGLGHLVDDPNHALHRLNYAHFHRRHLSLWPNLDWLIAELEALDHSGVWEKASLKRLVASLRSGAS